MTERKRDPKAYLYEAPGTAGVGDVLAPEPPSPGAPPAAEQRPGPRARQTDLEKEAMKAVLACDGSWDQAAKALDQLQSNPALALVIAASGAEPARQVLNRLRDQLDDEQRQ